MNLLQEVQAVDREVADAITAEMERQKDIREKDIMADVNVWIL